MKQLTALLFFFLLSACNRFEGEVHVNEKSIVKFHGGGVSEKEAEQLGHFLLKQGYFNTFDQRTVYLRKKEQQFEVTFIVDRDLFMSDKENLGPGFEVWHQWISEEVFSATVIRLVVADERRQALYTIAKDTTY